MKNKILLLIEIGLFSVILVNCNSPKNNIALETFTPLISKIITPFPTYTAINTITATPTTVPTIVHSISVGWFTTCAVINSGSVKCWGDLTKKPYGDEIFSSRNVATPEIIKGLENNIKIITAGESHYCVILQSGELKCMGLNRWGSLGSDDIYYSDELINVPGIDNEVSQLINESWLNCAVLKNASVKCWPASHFNKKTSGNTPIIIDQLNGNVHTVDMAYTSSGNPYLCALLLSGDIKCIDFDKDTTRNIGEINKAAIAISVGEYFGCAILSDHKMKCWGINTNGQLGNGTYVDSNNAISIKGIDKEIKLITVAYEHACAITVDNIIYCWGNNRNNQLGKFEGENSNIPILIAKMETNIISIESQYSTICVLLENSKIECWGFNRYGQVGNGSFSETVKTPSEVTGL
jgi:alpha-tubulin suppressor-like RCC1 family protein